MSFFLGGDTTASSTYRRNYGTSSYSYQSFNPINSTFYRRNYPAPVEYPYHSHHSEPSLPVKNPAYYSSYSYSYSQPSSYSSSIHAIPQDKNQPHNRYRYLPMNLTHTRDGHRRPPPYGYPGLERQPDSSGVFSSNPRPPYSIQHPKHFQRKDDEVINGRKIYKNPRNVPSENCTRDEEAAKREVSWFISFLYQITFFCGFKHFYKRSK